LTLPKTKNKQKGKTPTAFSKKRGTSFFFACILQAFYRHFTGILQAFFLSLISSFCHPFLDSRLNTR